MASLPDANVPFAPFYYPVPVVVPGPFDAPLVCFQLNETWMTYLMGAAACLMAASTWDSDDENVVRTVTDNARRLIESMMQFEACPVSITFRVNPVDGHLWDYSLDAGGTWIAGPDTAAAFTPTWTIDSDAPGGYDLSVNGTSQSDVPMLTATDPNAVIKDPSTADENVVEATATAPGMTVQGTQLGVGMVRNGASLQLQKITDLGNLAEAIIDAVETGDYTTAILSVVDAI